MHTAAADRSIAEGVLAQLSDGMIVLTLPGTDYRLHLAVASPPADMVGQRVVGRIRARAKRVDRIRSGGRYVEPVYGRPRRLQGRIVDVDTDPGANTLTVYCGCPFICELTVDQKARDFHPGELVSFDVERGAWFEPVLAPAAAHEHTISG